MRHLFRFRLLSIFLLTAFVAVVLFLHQHLGLDLSAGPPCEDKGNKLLCGFYIRIEWDGNYIWSWSSEDAGIPAPPVAIKDWCKKVGLFQ